MGPQVVTRVRPVAKAALKTALLAANEARVRGAELTEAAEDLFAEARAEATSEAVASAMAAAQARAAASSGAAPETGTKHTAAG
jgi:hypothetical protein